MAQKIKLIDLDPGLTVGQLLASYKPFGFEAWLYLENVPVIIDTLTGLQAQIQQEVLEQHSATPVPDPTHGRIDADIQQAVDEMKPSSLGSRVAMENTLQERRDRAADPLDTVELSLPVIATEEDEQRALAELEVGVNGELVAESGQGSNLESTQLSDPAGAPAATPSSTTCGYLPCEAPPEEGKKYCGVQHQRQEAARIRKERGRPTGPGRGNVRPAGEPVDTGPCPCGCGARVMNHPGGRRRKWATDDCRKRAAKKGSTTPVVEPTVETPPEPAGPASTEAPAPAAPTRCGRCDQPGHWAIDCPFKSQQAARKALGTEKPPSGKLKAPSQAVEDAKLDQVEVARTAKAPVIDPRPSPERPAPQQRVRVEGLPRDVDDEQLGLAANAHRERWAKGYPHSFSYLPDVLALYGVTEELVESALRNPDRVEVRPESFDKVKRYPVLVFARGDVQVILGLRDPANPCVIAVYVTALLEHDTHRVSHTGGGGPQKEHGVPTTPAKVAQRLRGLGAKVAVDGREDKALVTYRDQELGYIQTGQNTPRLTCQADFQRMQRKMHAIDRRETAGVGGRS